jgi:hypothetical protein
MGQPPELEPLRVISKEGARNFSRYFVPTTLETGLLASEAARRCFAESWHIHAELGFSSKAHQATSVKLSQFKEGSPLLRRTQGRESPLEEWPPLRRLYSGGSRFEARLRLRGHAFRYLAINPKRTEPIARIELVKGPDNTAPIVMAVTIEGDE